MPTAAVSVDLELLLNHHLFTSDKSRAVRGWEMALSKSKVETFLSVWKFKFIDRLLSSLNGLGLGVTLLGFFGLTAGSFPYAGWLVLALPGTAVWAGVRSLPRFRVSASEVVGKKIELEELDSILIHVPVIGLLGVHEVGKTTFLNAVFHRTEPKRRTAKPYAVVVQLPDTEPASFAALVDSVGERYENQFQVILKSEVACIFLDHNPSDSLGDVAGNRIDDEQHFLDQLVLTRRANTHGADRAIVVQNKSDLWAANTATRLTMDRLSVNAVKIISTVCRAGGVARVDRIQQHAIGRRCSTSLGNKKCRHTLMKTHHKAVRRSE